MNLKGDYGNIAFLLLLYVLQGIPIGLSSAIPLLLQNRKVSYSEQALFSFVTWPFSLKLLWAPIVDSVFWRKIGRRKSWLVPVQLAIGLFMLLLSASINSLMADNPATGQKPNIQLLTFIFLMLNFLAATQDIAVDGWALTMLSRRNIGHASTCNTVGQTAGYFIGNIIFLALESADFSNKYIRPAGESQPFGVVTFEGYLRNCGIIFLVVTILVAIFKAETSTTASESMRSLQSELDKEVTVRLKQKTKRANQHSDKNVALVKQNHDDENEYEDDSPDSNNLENDLSVRETYSLLYKIMKLSSFKLFAVVLLTCKIGFSAPDAVSGLKLIEAGVHKENMALLAVPMVPLQIVLPWIISRMTCGPRPLDILIKAYPLRLLFGLVFPLIVYITPAFKLADGTFPMYYYFMIIVVYALHQITVYSIFVALMAFHAAVSDPAIGGTYMTLLNTITNLGGNWPSTAALWLVDKLTVENCAEVCSQTLASNSSNSSTTATSNPNLQCKSECVTTIDGYYLECVICVVFGFLWLRWGRGKLHRLQTLPPVAWKVSMNKPNK